MKNWTHALPFTAPFLVLILTTLGTARGGISVLAATAFIFVVHPTLDLLTGTEKPQPGNELPPAAPAWLHDLLLWAYVPAQTALLAFCLTRPLDPTSWEFYGVAISLGCTTGAMGITIGHELIHRTRGFERALGAFLYMQVNYGHFETEHTLGHHVWVGTPRDPATARAGQTLFQFLPQTLLGQVRSAWRLKPKRTALYISSQVLFLLVLALTLGGAAVALHIAQSIVAVLMLETINYVEHYGLSRREVRPGVYEKVTETHSWNSLHRMTNWFLFNLGRHAEHHAHPRVHYQKLKTTERPRTLPYGYSAMLILAWFPPVWRRIFHGRGPDQPGHLARTVG